MGTERRKQPAQAFVVNPEPLNPKPNGQPAQAFVVTRRKWRSIIGSANHNWAQADTRDLKTENSDTENSVSRKLKTEN